MPPIRCHWMTLGHWDSSKIIFLLALTLPGRSSLLTNFPHTRALEILRKLWKRLDACIRDSSPWFLAMTKAGQNTASYHWSKVEPLGRNRETCSRGALVSAHGEATLPWNTPVTTPFRTFCSCWRKLSTGRESQFARIEQVSCRTLPPSYGLMPNCSFQPALACSCCCRSSSSGSARSNHGPFLCRYSSSLASRRKRRCGTQWAGNQTYKESAGHRPPIQSETVLVCAFWCLAWVLTGFGWARILASPLHGLFRSPSLVTLCLVVVRRLGI